MSDSEIMIAPRCWRAITVFNILGLIILICLGLVVGAQAQTVPLPVTVMDFGFTGTINNIALTDTANSKLQLDADRGDDAADLWTIQSTASDNDLDFISDTTTVANMTTAGALTIAANFTTTYMKLTPQASAPGSPASGHIYVDSTATPDELCFYDGAGWQGISSGTDGNCV